ncbi:hypothetical protein [Streptomyces chryseus]
MLRFHPAATNSTPLATNAPSWPPLRSSGSAAQADGVRLTATAEQARAALRLGFTGHVAQVAPAIGRVPAASGLRDEGTDGLMGVAAHPGGQATSAELKMDLRAEESIGKPAPGTEIGQAPGASAPSRRPEPWEVPVDAKGRNISVGDLVMQGFYEITNAYSVERLCRQGNMAVDAVRTTAAGEQVRLVDHCNRVVRVTQEQVDALAPHLRVSANGHRGWIAPGNPVIKPGKFRATCACLGGMEIPAEGHSRAIAWFASQEQARAAWERHAAEPFAEDEERQSS